MADAQVQQEIRGECFLQTTIASSTLNFTCFPNLPLIPRLRIWSSTFEPRVVEIVWNKSKTKRFSKSPIPIALSVCQESRCEGMRHYSRIGYNKNIYANPTIDTLSLSLETVKELDEFRGVDIRWLALDGYWVEGWIKKDEIDETSYQLFSFQNLQTIIIVLNLNPMNHRYHNGSERLVAPLSEMVAAEWEEVMPLAHEYFRKCEKQSSREMPALEGALITRNGPKHAYSPMQGPFPMPSTEETTDRRGRSAIASIS